MNSGRQIARLKATARHHWEAYHAAIEGMDCGATIAQHISSDAATHAYCFDQAMDALAAIDPDCPKRRLSTAEKV